jgi:hypothetical protein
MLTAEQLEEFRRTGVVILRGFYSTEEVTRWRRDAIEHFGNPAAEMDWNDALQRHEHSSFRVSDDPTPATDERLRRLFASLGTSDWTGNNELIVRPPQPDTPWLGARAPHIDFPVGVPIRYLANTLTYFTPIESRGGAFMYWPGSHLVAWRHFAEYPLDYLSRGERSQGQTFELLMPRMPGQPVEFLGRPGDLLVWHHLLFHSPSVNKRPTTRLAYFGRWGQALDDDEPLYDFSGSPWRWRMLDNMANMAYDHLHEINSQA